MHQLIYFFKKRHHVVVETLGDSRQSGANHTMVLVRGRHPHLSTFGWLLALAYVRVSIADSLYLCIIIIYIYMSYTHSHVSTLPTTAPSPPWSSTQGSSRLRTSIGAHCIPPKRTHWDSALARPLPGRFHGLFFWGGTMSLCCFVENSTPNTW